MDEPKLLETLKIIVETLDKIVDELDQNLGPQAVDTIKEPIAKAHRLLTELIDNL
ncbi:MAG: hypothetical protein U9Q81_23845 [Pseudomonadota bacterium]|nr:hypothetical protein [Pseudomonadota bacterium]